MFRDSDWKLFYSSFSTALLYLQMLSPICSPKIKLRVTTMMPSLSTQRPQSRMAFATRRSLPVAEMLANKCPSLPANSSVRGTAFCRRGRTKWRRRYPSRCLPRGKSTKTWLWKAEQSRGSSRRSKGKSTPRRRRCLSTSTSASTFTTKMMLVSLIHFIIINQKLLWIIFIKWGN